MLQKILSYFGTWTPGTEGSISTFTFEYLTTLALAAVVILSGRWLVNHVQFLKKYGFPAPVVAGIIFSLGICVLNLTGLVDIRFDTSFMRELCQNLFFLCVGFGFSTKMLKKAGPRLCALIIASVVILITLQGVLGIAVALLMGKNPLMGVICSAGAMSGGVGTASAFGPVYESWGCSYATAVGVAAGVMGNLMGSLIGGPVAVFLIKRHSLHADSNDQRPESADSTKAYLSSDNLAKSFALILLLAGFGMILYFFLNQIPLLDMPVFVGCIFAGAIGRNVMDALGIKYHLPEIDALQDVMLDVYLALVLMGTNFADLIPFAGTLFVMLLTQAILIVLFGIFVTYNIFGRDYSAALMTAGCIGWGCGSGTNAVANEKALMEQYGYDSLAAELYPSFAVIMSDIYDPLFMSIAGAVFRT